MSNSPLRGRSLEMSLILQSLAEAESGRGGVILISGDVGVGKTRLVHEVCGIAEKREFTVVRAETDPFPPPTAEHPVLAVLDDLHVYADQALLSRMTARLAALRHQPQVWLLTLRDQAYGLAAHRFVRALEDGGCTRLTLGPLAPDAVRELLADTLGARPDPGLTELADEAAGHPLLTAALAAGLREDGRVRVVGQTAELTSAAVPDRLRSTVNCLLKDHGEQIQDMLRTAALLGPEFGVEDLAAVLVDVPPASLAACVQRAIDAGLLDCRSSDRLAFRYELVRRTIVESTALGVRQVLLHAASAPARADRLPRSGTPGAPARFAPPPRSSTAMCLVQEDSMVALSAGAVSLLYEGRTDQAQESASALLHGCPASGEGPGQALMTLVHSVGARAGGRAAEALWLSRQATALLPPGRSSLVEELIANCVALELSLLGETAEAEQLLRKVACWEGESGAPPASLVRGAIVARIMSAKGDHRKAGRWAEAALGVVDRRHRWLLPLAGAVHALAALRGGELCAAEGLVARYEAEREPDRHVLYAQPDWVALQVATERHGAAQGAELLTGRLAQLIDTPVLFVEEPGAAPWMVRTALAANAPQLAEKALRAVRTLAHDNSAHAPLTVSALHADGVLRQDGAALARARGEHRDVWAAAWAAEDLGTLLLGRGEGAARREFVAARELYEEAGAGNDVARITGRLTRLALPKVPPPAASGAPAAPRGPAERPADPGQALTGSERAVAELVVLGMTNRQVAGKLHLSSYTVNYHLRNIFRKFGIKSRVELARWYQDCAAGTVLPATAGNFRPAPTFRSGVRST
ncbi:LuxR C-terminal-related transcriptional regulator [Streptomyces sp. NPDC050263]|uniref:helix-turn-helix transcriptional regulator n=1 Tax=Streptomyces sp. NPDC050263 TaxID=3155037 RepID=UPI0034461079